MIKISVSQTEGQCRSIRVEGHAGYAEEGYDIVCAAVSVLVINTINSIEQLTDADFSGEMPQNGEGVIAFTLDSGSKEADLLFDAMMLGLSDIRDQYSDYISIIRKEVAPC